MTTCMSAIESQPLELPIGPAHPLHLQGSPAGLVWVSPHRDAGDAGDAGDAHGDADWWGP